ncbi:hypothetical protein [Paraglaciecola sp.]|uniref:hypothetical protein n=1 Tax=Paraglaciecola sp. TaxID=1920173 RepID=UPI003EF19BDB
MPKPLRIKINASTTRSIKYACCGFALLSTQATYASNIYVGYVSDEQDLSILNDTLSLAPNGAIASVSLDLHDNWSVAASYTQLSDKGGLETGQKGETDSHNWNLGVDFNLDAWSLSASYGEFQEDSVAIRKNSLPLSSQSNQISSAAINLSYDKLINTWLLTGSIGAVNSQWEQLESNYRLDTNQPTLSATSETLNFATVGLSAAKVIDWKTHTIFLGAGLAKSFLLTQEPEQSQIETPLNSPRISGRIASRNLTSSISNDSYSLLSLFFSYELNEQVSLDLDSQISIEKQDTYQSFAIGVNYSF